MLLRRAAASIRRLAVNNHPDNYTLPGEKFIKLADTQRKGDQETPVFFVQDEEQPIDYDNVSFSKCKEFILDIEYVI
jgi:hypothetical protein